MSPIDTKTFHKVTLLPPEQRTFQAVISSEPGGARLSGNSPVRPVSLHPDDHFVARTPEHLIEQAGSQWPVKIVQVLNWLREFNLPRIKGKNGNSTDLPSPLSPHILAILSFVLPSKSCFFSCLFYFVSFSNTFFVQLSHCCWMITCC